MRHCPVTPPMSELGRMTSGGASPLAAAASAAAAAAAAASLAALAAPFLCEMGASLGVNVVATGAP